MGEVAQRIGTGRRAVRDAERGKASTGVAVYAALLWAYYITLPGKVSAVTAGKFVLDESSSGVPLGRFVYGRSYLKNADAVPIDPAELKLSDTTYSTILLRGVFGASRDAGPDYWGRRVIEKHAGKPSLREMDYLLESPEDRAGALGFGIGNVPPAPLKKFNKTLDLAKLQCV